MGVKKYIYVGCGWGKNIILKRGGGGKKYDFKKYIYPCICLKTSVDKFTEVLAYCCFQVFQDPGCYSV